MRCIHQWKQNCDFFFPSLLYVFIQCCQFHNVTLSDLEVLFELGLKCNVDQLRVNAISVVSTIGTSLAKQSPPHPLLQV